MCVARVVLYGFVCVPCESSVVRLRMCCCVVYVLSVL